jgi:phage repressor protein C with HTH and peptisase S24 domain
MAKLLKDRLETLVKESGRSRRDISMKATGKPDTIRDIMRDKVVNGRSDTLAALASELRSSVGYLTGESDNPRPNHQLRDDMIAALVVGVAQAGAFMDIDASVKDEHFDPEWVPSVRDPQFPSIAPIAYEVVGDSINRVCENGGHAICLPFHETGLRLRNGMWVIARRVRGALVELTVKQVAGSQDNFELRPASTNPKHKPIRFPSAEPSEEVTVVAVVRRFLSPSLPI